MAKFVSLVLLGIALIFSLGIALIFSLGIASATGQCSGTPSFDCSSVETTECQLNNVPVCHWNLFDCINKDCNTLTSESNCNFAGCLWTNEVTDCQDISSPGTYILQNNISTTDTCFNISSNDIILDLNNFNVSGDNNGEDYGVYANGRTNITVKNGRIEWFGKDTINGVGIYFTDVNDSLIQNVTLDNNKDGLVLSSFSNNNNFSNLTFLANNGVGIYLDSSQNNTFYDINLTSNSVEGMRLTPSSDNNSFYTLWAFNNTIGINLDSNSNNNFYNLTSKSNSEIGLGINGGSNNTFYNTTLMSNALRNLNLDSTSNNNFHDLSASGSARGIFLSSSTGNNFYNSNVFNNTLYGLVIDSDSGSNLFNSLTAYSSDNEEILVIGTPNNVLSYNNSFGEIKFFQIGSLEGNLTFGYPETLQLENNSAYVNSVNLPALNISANVTLNLDGWNISNPRVNKDGVVCSVSECSVLEYNSTSGIIVFSVSGWSNYSIDEMPRPSFSNLFSNNASFYDSGVGIFNVTVSDTNGTVWLEVNNTNVSATDLQCSGNSNYSSCPSPDTVCTDVEGVEICSTICEDISDDLCWSGSRSGSLGSCAKSCVEIAAGTDEKNPTTREDNCATAGCTWNAGLYEANYSFSPAGNYNYQWWAFGNGSTSNINNSGYQVFRVLETQNNDNPGGNNNGGGGGGGPGYSTFNLNSTQLSEGFSKVFGLNDRFNFSFENQTHYALLKNKSNSSVSIEVHSVVKTITVLLGQSTKLDLDDDGKYDFVFSFLSFTNTSKALISIKSISEVISNSGLPTNNQTTSSNNSSSEKVISLPHINWIYILLGSIILFVFIVVLLIILAVRRVNRYRASLFSGKRNSLPERKPKLSKRIIKNN
jgi:hypothetical protein